MDTIVIVAPRRSVVVVWNSLRLRRFASRPVGSMPIRPAVTLSAPLGANHVSVRIDTTRRGAQAMTLHILTAAGAPVPARTVTATLSSAQVAALRLTLRRPLVEAYLAHLGPARARQFLVHDARDS